MFSSNTLMPFLPPHERPIPHSLDRCPCSLPFPPGVATLEDLKLHIAGDTLTVVAKIKLLDMVAELELVSSLTPESDIRIRETCAGLLTFPTFLKAFLDVSHTHFKPGPGLSMCNTLTVTLCGGAATRRAH